MEMKIKKALQDLNTLGYYKTNVVEVLDDNGLNLFNNNIDFFNQMLSSEYIQNELNIIQTNPEERRHRSGGKPFEITHYHYLNRALTINDGSLFYLYLHNYFTEIAEKFLDTPTPQIFNVLGWIHSWNNQYGRQHSQNWHRDREDYKLLKIFIYYSEVGEKNGPFEYTPKSFCGGDFHGLYEGRSGYWDYAGNSDNSGCARTQEEINICDSTHISFTGKPGDIIMVNNSGFHRGGFVEEGIRVMSHALYLKPDAELIKNGYFTGFNYEPNMVNYIDFDSEEFNELKNKQKYFKINIKK